jgi:hypothetical protein
MLLAPQFDERRRQAAVKSLQPVSGRMAGGRIGIEQDLLPADERDPAFDSKARAVRQQTRAFSLRTSVNLSESEDKPNRDR